jgi:hypothetical protein
VKTRKELERFQALYHQNLSSIKASEGLATILNQQRNPNMKNDLGYEEGSGSVQPRNKESYQVCQILIINDNSQTLQKQRKTI